MKDTNTPSTTKNQPVNAPTRRHNYRLSARYHAELARYSTWMFGSITIAITFLLLAGLRNPRLVLLICMYVAIGAFALTVLLYPLINLYHGKLLALVGAQDDLPSGKAGKEATEALATETQRQQRRLTIISRAHQAVFLIGVLATIGFAIEVSLYLFAVPQTQAPAGASGAGGPAGT